ncbi:hypothetical protein J6590_082620 [Homalodisca vitripennis]|nr:hypothetical protein J6590_082620 [Homalodisca vitripennis]
MLYVVRKLLRDRLQVPCAFDRRVLESVANRWMKLMIVKNLKKYPAVCRYMYIACFTKFLIRSNKHGNVPQYSTPSC